MGLFSKEIQDKDVMMDAAIVGSAQAVEHHEMARCGTLIARTHALGPTTSSASSARTSTKKRLPTRSFQPLRFASGSIARPRAEDGTLQAL
jgi:hypothetical protein